MKREDVIRLTDKLLNSVPSIKERIRLIDKALKIDAYDTETIERLKSERDKLHGKLSKIINAVSELNEENQKIICYRYFDNMKYKDISFRVDLKDKAIKSRINTSLLDIGKIIFGFQEDYIKLVDECWNAFCGIEVEETEEQIINRAAAYTTKKVMKIIGPLVG
jgi:hypothetical protein